MKTSVVRFRGQPNSRMFLLEIFNLIISAKICFPNQVTIQVSGGYILAGGEVCVGGTI